MTELERRQGGGKAAVHPNFTSGVSPAAEDTRKVHIPSHAALGASLTASEGAVVGLQSLRMAPVRWLFPAGASTAQKCLRGTGLVLATAILVGDHTSVFLHLTVFGIVFWLCHLLNQWITGMVQSTVLPKYPTVRSILSGSIGAEGVQSSSIAASSVGGSNKVIEDVVVRCLTLFGWLTVRWMSMPEVGKGGSTVTLLLTIQSIASLLQLVIAIPQAELLAPLFSKPGLVVFALYAYFIIVQIIGPFGLDVLRMNIWIQFVVITAAAVAIMKVFGPKRTVFPCLCVSLIIPFLALLGTSLIFACLLATNPSWAFVEKNSKAELLQKLGAPDAFILDAKEICTPEEVKSIDDSEFPLILKPSVCTTSNQGVRPAYNKTDVLEYLERVPFRGPLQRGACFTMSQKFFSSKTEAVVFYMRYPYMRGGFVKALGERGKARPKGDGEESRHYGKAFFGEYFFSALRNDLVTDELLAFLDGLSHRFPGGWFSGRLDVKVKELADISTVTNLGILEVNLNAIGDIVEKDLRDWNRDSPTLLPYHTGLLGLLRPLRQVRTIIVQIYIGLINILNGNIPPLTFVSRLPIVVGRAELCSHDYMEHLFGRE
jgi:hypothetical protein